MVRRDAPGRGAPIGVTERAAQRSERRATNRRLDDVESVHTDLYRANAIDADDTSVVRVRAADGLTVTCALSLSSQVQTEPLIYVEGKHGRATFGYTEDRVQIDAGGATPNCVRRSFLFVAFATMRGSGVPMLR